MALLGTSRRARNAHAPRGDAARGGVPTPGRSGAPLLVTADASLRHEVLRLAAAAGVEPVVVDDAASAASDWRRACLVLVGPDASGDLSVLGPVRRPGVHLLSCGPPGEEAVRAAIGWGARSVEELPQAGAWLAGALAESDESSRGRGPVIGVLAGGGGAGASVFAAALTRSAGRSAAALLVDLDGSGPGAHRVLGVEGTPTVGWESLHADGGRMAGHALRESLPRVAGARVLTWLGLPAPPPAATVREVVEAGARGHGVVVVDLPRHADAAESLAGRLDLVVLVARPDLTGLASAGRRVTRWADLAELGVVLRGPRARTGLVRDVAGVPVLTAMADQRRLVESLDLGFGPVRTFRGPLARAARLVLDTAGVAR